MKKTVIISIAALAMAACTVKENIPAETLVFHAELADIAD